MKNFITYRIAATLQLLVFFFIAVIFFRPAHLAPDNWYELDGFGSDDWPEFFQMPVLMLMLITLLNDGTLISIGYDYVTPSKYPNVWNLRVVFAISSVLAAVALISSIILLALCLNSWNEGSSLVSHSLNYQDNHMIIGSVFQKIGIGGLEYGQITTTIYLKVSISDFLTLFSAR